jgi:hypothetical protein
MSKSASWVNKPQEKRKEKGIAKGCLTKLNPIHIDLTRNYTG